MHAGHQILAFVAIEQDVDFSQVNVYKIVRRKAACTMCGVNRYFSKSKNMERDLEIIAVESSRFQIAVQCGKVWYIMKGRNSRKISGNSVLILSGVNGVGCSCHAVEASHFSPPIDLVDVAVVWTGGRRAKASQKKVA